MASEVKANKVSPSSGTDLTLGDASDTVIVPTGVTLNIVDDLGVAYGGTGLSSFTAGDILYASGTTTLSKLAKGTAEQVLAMNSGATAPDWGSVDLTVLPTITAAKGGTGQTSYTTGDTVYASGSTAVSKLGIGTARQALQTNSGATAPEWVNSPQSLMTAAGDILYASGANTLAKLAKGSDDEVLTLASGVPSWATASSGGFLQIKQTVVTAATASQSFSPGSWYALTGMTVDITPAATANKILVLVDAKIYQSQDVAVLARIKRDSTAIYVGDAASARIRCSGGIGAASGTYGGANNEIDATFMFLDDPSSTSAVTYSIDWAGQSGSTGYLNRTAVDTDVNYFPRTASSITVIEVASGAL